MLNAWGEEIIGYICGICGQFIKEGEQACERKCTVPMLVRMPRESKVMRNLER